MSALSVLFERILSQVRDRSVPEQFVELNSCTEEATTVASPKSELTGRDLLAPVSAIVARIKTAYGFDDTHFDTHVMEVLRGLAIYLHQLPATPNREFSGSSGALRMALEIGLYSLQAAEGRTFGDNDDVGPASYMKHRWRLASLLGGLFSELHRVFGHVQVFNDSGESWPMECLPLNSWLSETAAKRYSLKWRNAAIDARALTLHIASQVIPHHVIAYLAAGNSVVVPQLFSCIAGGNHPSEKNVINEIVRRTASAILDRNMRDRAGQSFDQMGEKPDLPVKESLDTLPLEHQFLQCATAKSTNNPAPPSRQTHGKKYFQSGDTADLFASTENRESDEDTSRADQNYSSETTLTSLRLDCSGIVNPVVREVMEAVISHVNSSFDTMLARICDDGLFIALSEFESAFSDTSILVRSLAEAKLLYLDPAEPHKKLRSIEIKGSSVQGIVILRSFFLEWDSWLSRWEKCFPGKAVSFYSNYLSQSAMY